MGNRLGEEEGRGFVQLMQQLPQERLNIAQAGVVTMERAIELTLDFVKQREAFGKPLSKHEAIRHKVANMGMELEAARSLVYRAARLKDAGEPFEHIASMAKLFASEAGMRACNQAIQCLGGYGYMHEYEVERMWRDCKLCEIGEGTSEIQRLILGRHYLD